MFQLLSYLGDFFVEFELRDNVNYRYCKLINDSINQTEPIVIGSIEDLKDCRIEVQPQYLISSDDLHRDSSSVLSLCIDDDKITNYGCQLSTMLLVSKALGIVKKEQILDLITDIRKNNTFCNFEKYQRLGSSKFKIFDLVVRPIERIYYSFIFKDKNGIIYEVKRDETFNKYALILSLPLKDMELVNNKMDGKDQLAYQYKIDRSNVGLILNSFKLISCFSRKDQENIISILNQIIKYYDIS